jgi:SAM-dependent methyltransferase
MTADPDPLPANLFDRVDEAPDEHFYGVPRLVTHIDETTIGALRDYYGETLPTGGDILDLMSSWVSHLPHEMEFGRVAVLGMNEQELAANERATETLVHDLNADPELPYPAESFDAVINAVSVQYLVNPVPVFASIRRVLRPGGISIVAMSHRCFPTKAVRAFHTLPPRGRFDLVNRYFELAGGFDRIEQIDRSPPDADPLWIVTARRAASA